MEEICILEHNKNPDTCLGKKQVPTKEARKKKGKAYGRDEVVARTFKPHISSRNQDGLRIDNEIIEVSSLSSGNREERVTPIHGTVVSTYSGKTVRALSGKSANTILHTNIITALAFIIFVFATLETSVRILNDQKCLWCWILRFPFHIMLGTSHVCMILSCE